MVWLTPAEYNVSSMSEWLLYTDYITNGWLGIMLIILTFVITFAAAKTQETSQALAYASTVSLVIGIFLKIFGLVTTRALIAFIVFIIIAAIYHKLQDE